MERLGIVDDIRAERARILANVPAAHRARLLGRPAPYAEPKAHAITVNLKTGERTVTPVTMLALPKPKPAPPVVRVEQPVQPAVRGPIPEAIISAILTATGISRYEYLRQGRSGYKISRARQMGYWITKQVSPNMSFPEMGRMFVKDHSTILAGRRKGELFKDTSPICDWLAHPAILVSLLREE